MNTILRDVKIPVKYLKKERDITLPIFFDWRETDYILKPKKQGSCGSCWAFVSSSVLSERINIKNKTKINLSPSKMVLCQQDNKGCMGKSLYEAWKYLYTFGTVEESCFNVDISIGELDNVRSCEDLMGRNMDMCQDGKFNIETGEDYGTPAKFWRCKEFYMLNGVEEIMKDVYLHGPVSTAMIMYPDFYNIKNDIIYSSNKSEKIGGHAVEIVGWGEKDNIKYWIVKNSWGDDWNDNGFFKIVRGVNECGIEENVVGCIPTSDSKGYQNGEYLSTGLEKSNDILENGYTKRVNKLFNFEKKDKIDWNLIVNLIVISILIILILKKW